MSECLVQLPRLAPRHTRRLLCVFPKPMAVQRCLTTESQRAQAKVVNSQCPGTASAWLRPGLPRASCLSERDPGPQWVLGKRCPPAHVPGGHDCGTGLAGLPWVWKRISRRLLRQAHAGPLTCLGWLVRMAQPLALQGRWPGGGPCRSPVCPADERHPSPRRW